MHNNPDRAAIIRSLADLSRWVGARLVAEGVEDINELAALAALGVDYAQGWAIARPDMVLPAVAPAAVTACRRARQALLAQGGATNASVFRALPRGGAATVCRTDLGKLSRVLSDAANTFGVDVIGVSVLLDEDHVREVAATGRQVDQNRYALSEFLTTPRMGETGSMAESHLDDLQSEPVRARSRFAAGQLASVLTVPLFDQDIFVGILELGQRTTRRWSGHDLQQARALAEHLTPALRPHRMTQGRPRLMQSQNLPAR